MAIRRSDREVITAPRVPWEKLCRYVAAEFELGEHVSCEGPTGSGKSVLMRGLLMEIAATLDVPTGGTTRPVRISALGIKNTDKTLAGFGWPRITKLADWPPGYGEEHVLAWPRYGTASSAAKLHAEFFRPVLDQIKNGGPGIAYIDEVAYFAEKPPDGLGLGNQLNQFWIMARSDHVSLWGATQRPTRVPRAMWSEASWMFLFRPEDEEDHKTLAERSGQKQLVLDVLPTLDDHEFLMLRRRGGGREGRIAVVSQVSM